MKDMSQLDFSEMRKSKEQNLKQIGKNKFNYVELMTLRGCKIIKETKGIESSIRIFTYTKDKPKKNKNKLIKLSHKIKRKDIKFVSFVVTEHVCALANKYCLKYANINVKEKGKDELGNKLYKITIPYKLFEFLLIGSTVYNIDCTKATIDIKNDKGFITNIYDLLSFSINNEIKILDKHKKLIAYVIQ